MAVMQVNTPTSFEDSVGEPVALPMPARLISLGLKCWRPKLRVSEIFREIFPAILEVAKTHLESRPRSEDVVLGCYMLGYSSRTAVPYVSFASRDQKHRRELRKLVQKEVLKKYPGWKSLDWNQDPGSINMAACGSSAQDTLDSAPMLQIESATSGFGGSKISILGKSGTNEIWQHIATGGGILADGRGSYFLMTTAHSLPGYQGPSFPRPQTPDEFELNMDDLSDDEEPDELGASSTSLGSRTPSETRPSSSDELSSPKSQSEGVDSVGPSFFEENAQAILPPISADLQLPKEALATSTHKEPTTRASATQERHASLHIIQSKAPSITSSESSCPGLDYALIQVDGVELDSGAQSPETGRLVALDRPGPREVVVITSSQGKTKGQLLETPLFIVRSDTTSSQELWTVRLDKDTKEGDSGSWVFDARSGEVIGHIVATSAESGSTLIIPASQILHDLNQRFGGFWTPITNADGNLVLTSTALAQQTSARQSFPEPPVSIAGSIGPQVDSPKPVESKEAAMFALGSLSSRDQGQSLDNTPVGSTLRFGVDGPPEEQGSLRTEGDLQPYSSLLSPQKNQASLSNNVTTHTIRGMAIANFHRIGYQAKPRFLACPFWKLDPDKHWECFSRKNITISHLKQHLSRRHTPDFYCSRCHTIFSDDASYDTHVLGATCTRDLMGKPQGISHVQRQQLSRKYNVAVEGQWYAIWDILFPKYKRPATIYTESPQSEEFYRIRKFCQQDGVTILRDELESSGFFPRPDVSEEALRMTVQRAMESMFNTYELKRSSAQAETHGAYPSSRIDQLSSVGSPRAESIAESIADSGVGLPPLSHSSGDCVGSIMASPTVTGNDTDALGYVEHDWFQEGIELLKRQSGEASGLEEPRVKRPRREL